jgi:hypothetical protein
MAAADGLEIGMPMLFGSTGTGTNFFTLDSANDAVQAVFQAPDAVTITHLFVRQSVRTGTAPVYRVSLQGVNGTGEPDGSIKGGGTAKNDYTPVVGNDNAGVWLALDTPYACSRGEYLATNIQRTSGTIDAGNNCAFGYSGASDEPDTGFPYAYLVIDGSPSKIINSSPVYGFKSASKSYGMPTVLRSSFTSALASTPDERAVYVALPVGWGTSYTVRGIRFFGSMGSSGTVRMRLYDTNGTSVLQEAEHDSDYAGSTDFRWFTLYFDDTTLSALTFGSAYRLSLRSNGVNAVVIGYISVQDAGDMTAFPGGTGLSYSDREDDGAWTDYATRRLTVSLIIDDWTGSGGGGGPLIGGRLAIC